ncbi:unnamed protein product [Lota lota]
MSLWRRSFNWLNPKLRERNHNKIHRTNVQEQLERGELYLQGRGQVKTRAERELEKSEALLGLEDTPQKERWFMYRHSMADFAEVPAPKTSLGEPKRRMTQWQKKLRYRPNTEESKVQLKELKVLLFKR